MNAVEWQNALGKLAIDFVQTPAFVAYHSITMTPARARLSIKQQGNNVRNRRDQWALLFSKCPELDVRQKILEHEYEETVRDEYSNHGHLDLVVRQAAAVGLSPTEVLQSEPLPITRAICYAYMWFISHHTWQESLAGLTVNEMKNASSPMLEKVGGGGSERGAKRWMQDLGLSADKIPHSDAHSKADKKHGAMFLSVFERYVPAGAEESVLAAAQKALELRGTWYEGMSAELQRLS
jgi:pyrroloquinoline quinone (PQQ) biosynthesis protein C